MVLAIQETSKTLSYAPYYMALARLPGLVERLPDARPGQAAKSVLRGEADLCIGGLMRVLKERDDDPTNQLVCFADLVSRDGMVIVGRHASPNFTLADLRGSRLGAYAETPTAWLGLRHDLERIGLGSDTYAFQADSLAANTSALLAGTLDYMQAPFELAVSLQDQGVHVVYALGSRGPEAHSCFYALSQTLMDRRNELLALVREVASVLLAIPMLEPADIAAAIDAVEPSVKALERLEAIAYYQRCHIWAASPVIHPEGFATMQAFLRAGGFVHGDASFADVIDNSIALAAIQPGAITS